tara:strand:+ start:1240 stop:1605 length:366 start_codon:yes stop_codon:yes gene_type:complete
MIAAIKNGQMAHKLYVLQSKKKNCEALLNILWDEGFISGYKTSDTDSNTIVIYLKYDNKLPVINGLSSVSKPSLRVYYSLKQLWKFDVSQGLLILSTNKGLLSINTCKKLKLGGEPLIVIK